jgi:hypothetical protein
MRRPHRSNSALSNVRGIESIKTFYWTDSRFKKYVLPYISARENYYGRAASSDRKAARQWADYCEQA